MSVEMMVWSDIDGQGAGGSPGQVIVNVPSQDHLLTDIERRLVAGTGFCVATLNLDHVVKINSLPAFRDAYVRHSHVTADGNPIVWLLRLVGEDVQLVPGSELIGPVMTLAARLRVRVGLLGATDAILERAARQLEAAHPGLDIVAKIAPNMGFDPTGPEADACIDALERADVQLCFLAMGAPRQEIFAIHAQDRLPGTGFLSIGAGLDFIAGHQIRAPGLVRLLALEWAWRLAGDPGRLARRYAACLAILPRLTRIALKRRAQP